MEDTTQIAKIIMFLSRKHRSAMRLLSKSTSPLRVKAFDRQHSIPLLHNKGLVQITNDYVSLTILGQNVVKYWQNLIKQENRSKQIQLVERSPIKHHVLKKERVKQSNEFLELYKQGLSYRKIGVKYNISGERVKQILTSNTDFRHYLNKQQEAKIVAQEQKTEQIIHNLYSKSLAAICPERVAELWDYEKNGDLKPEAVLAGSARYLIWLKCSKGHSWSKTPNDIATIWKKNGTSGCPMCAGRSKKPERQPLLVDAHPGFVCVCWNYQKNNDLGLYPDKLTLSSNHIAWFQCPYDGHEWQKNINAMVSQQWSKGKIGCRVCNGTNERKDGEWERSNSLAVEFPDRVSKYWFYEANNKLELDPTELTCGSAKKAFFKCPIDGYEWMTTIHTISNSAWKKGNSGCPACRGLVTKKLHL